MVPRYTETPMKVGTKETLTLSDPHYIREQSNYAEHSSPTFLKHPLSSPLLNTEPALHGRFPSHSCGPFAGFLYFSGLKVTFRQMVSSLATERVMIPVVENVVSYPHSLLRD